MVEENRYAIGQVVLHGHEQTVLLRPLDNLLAMSILNLEKEITKPAAFEDQVPQAATSPEELTLTKKLIELSTPEKFTFADYKDEYTEKLTKLIESKVAGQEIAIPPVTPEPTKIINLMDALRASVAQAEQKGPGSAVKPPKKLAPSTGKEARGRKRKSS
jgi:DNA end-binding protein Ku